MAAYVERFTEERKVREGKERLSFTYRDSVKERVVDKARKRSGYVRRFSEGKEC